MLVILTKTKVFTVCQVCRRVDIKSDPKSLEDPQSSWANKCTEIQYSTPWQMYHRDTLKRTP